MRYFLENCNSDEKYKYIKILHAENFGSNHRTRIHTENTPSLYKTDYSESLILLEYVIKSQESFQ